MSDANVVSQWIIFAFLLTFFLNYSATKDQRNITAEPGQTVALTCKGPNTKIVLLEWSRQDLGSKYVFFLRNSISDTGYQHDTFTNRVELKDKEMKDGDMSLILKNVKNDDEGTYECRIDQSGTNRRKRATLDGDPICIIHLTVEPGDNRGHVGLIVGLSVAAVLVVAGIVGFVIYRKGHTQQDSY